MNPLVAAARAYLNVPFRHRGRKRSGLDCAGLVWMAYHDCGVDLPDFLLYGPEPHNDGLVSHITTALGPPVAVAPVRRPQLEVGDVIVIRFETEPHHVALLGNYPTGGLSMLHAYGQAAPKGRVVEHRLADDHIAKITHVFRKPV